MSKIRHQEVKEKRRIKRTSYSHFSMSVLTLRHECPHATACVHSRYGVSLVALIFCHVVASDLSRYNVDVGA